MKQVLQSYKTGQLRVADVPAPEVSAGSILVLTARSLVSVGTERMTIDLAKKSLLGKAKQRPDLVRKLVARATRDGVIPALRSAGRKLSQPIPLGYSCVGRVVAVGDGVTDAALGARVACAGANVANHAEVNLVPKNLFAPVPEGVSDDSAAFVTVGAIALQGVRQAVPTLGEVFAVIGLGLIGQLTVQLLKANGCRVIGIDLDPRKVALAKTCGADVAVSRNDDVNSVVSALTGGRGVDGVIITAATSSDDPVSLAGELCRDRGRVVAVGAVGLNIPRRPYYEKELVLLQSRSYGPGRYDPVYEDAGVDYPIGYVRWTEKRNMAAFLDQCASGKIDVTRLISHRFAIEDAVSAYGLLSTPGADPLGILLEYPATAVPASTVALVSARAGSAPAGAGLLRVGVVGAGAFAAGTLIPALAKGSHATLSVIASARGYTARHLAEEHSFASCTTSFESLIKEPIDAVVIATRHNLHAQQAIAALQTGKHVFVEKPPALNAEELDALLAAHEKSRRLLLVGYNRRFSALGRQLQAAFSNHRIPLVMAYRVNAGPLPADSWIYDPAVGGGRVIGEICHFVDFLSFITGALPVEVSAVGVAPTGGARPDENLIATIRFSDGSIGSIHYVATADPSAGKERVEILGDGAAAVLDDFRVLEILRNGKSHITRKLVQDKGHEAGIDAFVNTARLGGAPPIDIACLAATSRTTFAINQAISTGRSVKI